MILALFSWRCFLQLEAVWQDTQWLSGEVFMDGGLWGYSFCVVPLLIKLQFALLSCCVVFVKRSHFYFALISSTLVNRFKEQRILMYVILSVQFFCVQLLLCTGWQILSEERSAAVITFRYFNTWVWQKEIYICQWCLVLLKKKKTLSCFLQGGDIPMNIL